MPQLYSPLPQLYSKLTKYREMLISRDLDPTFIQREVGKKYARLKAKLIRDAIRKPRKLS